MFVQNQWYVASWDHEIDRTPFARTRSGDADKANEALIPDFWPCSRPDWTFDGGYFPIQCDYRLVIDNLMDLSHETYTNPGSIGQREILHAPIQTHTQGNCVIVSRWMPNIEAPPFWRN